MNRRILLAVVAILVFIVACGKQEGEKAKPVEKFSEEEITKLLSLYEYVDSTGGDYSHMLLYLDSFTGTRQILKMKIESGALTQSIGGGSLTSYEIEVNDNQLKAYSRSDGKKKLAFSANQLSSTEGMPAEIVRMVNMIELAKELNEKLEKANHTVRVFVSPYNTKIDLSKHQEDVLTKFRDNPGVVGTYLDDRMAEKVRLSPKTMHSEYSSFDKSFEIGKNKILSPDEWIDRMRNKTLRIDGTTGRVTR